MIAVVAAGTTVGYMIANAFNWHALRRASLDRCKITILFNELFSGCDGIPYGFVARGVITDVMVSIDPYVG